MKIERAACASGLSLIEVVIALGLLSMVLLSVSGAFVTGSRLILGARRSSAALSVAAAILEEMQLWSFDQTYGLWAEPSCRAGFDHACSVDTSTQLRARDWQLELDRVLPRAGARAEIRVASLDGDVLGASAAVRIRVSVRWREGQRDRRVDLVTVRL